MSTVYTYNNKVLKNSSNDKWLAKKETPTPVFEEITIGTQTRMAKNLAINDGGEGIYTYNVGTLNNVE